VADRPQLRQPPGVVAAVLLICTLVGLLAGVGTRQVVTRLTNATHLGQDGLGPHGTTSAVTPTSTAGPLRSPTATAANPGEFSHFTVQAQVSPSSVAPGQQFTITATVIARDGVTPLGGVLCSIGAPGDGNQSLFPQWPAGIVSNTHGEATWTLQAPNVPKGTYYVKVSATAANGNFYFADVSVIISG
jgi:hypothetical protein